MKESNRIDRVTFEMQIATLPEVAPVQERLSTFAAMRLEDIIDAAVLEARAVNLRIDTLSLDLGEIPASQLEDTLETRLAEALSLALRQAVLHTRPGAEVGRGTAITGTEPGTPDRFRSGVPETDIRQVQPPVESADVRDLRHYLLHGSYAHWPGADAPGLPGLLHSALDRDAAAVSAMVETIGARPEVRKRLRNQTTPALRSALDRAGIPWPGADDPAETIETTPPPDSRPPIRRDAISPVAPPQNGPSARPQAPDQGHEIRETLPSIDPWGDQDHDEDRHPTTVSQTDANRADRPIAQTEATINRDAATSRAGPDAPISKYPTPAPPHAGSAMTEPDGAEGRSGTPGPAAAHEPRDHEDQRTTSRPIARSAKAPPQAPDGGPQPGSAAPSASGDLPVSPPTRDSPNQSPTDPASGEVTHREPGGTPRSQSLTENAENAVPPPSEKTSAAPRPADRANWLPTADLLSTAQSDGDLRARLCDPAFRDRIVSHATAAQIEALHQRLLPGLGGFAVTVLRLAATAQAPLGRTISAASLAALAGTTKRTDDAMGWLMNLREQALPQAARDSFFADLRTLATPFAETQARVHPLLACLAELESRPNAASPEAAPPSSGSRTRDSSRQAARDLVTGFLAPSQASPSNVDRVPGQGHLRAALAQAKPDDVAHAVTSRCRPELLGRLKAALGATTQGKTTEAPPMPVDLALAVLLDWTDPSPLADPEARVRRLLGRLGRSSADDQRSLRSARDQQLAAQRAPGPSDPDTIQTGTRVPDPAPPIGDAIETEARTVPKSPEGIPPSACPLDGSAVAEEAAQQTDTATAPQKDTTGPGGMGLDQGSPSARPDDLPTLARHLRSTGIGLDPARLLQILEQVNAEAPLAAPDQPGGFFDILADRLGTTRAELGTRVTGGAQPPRAAPTPAEQSAFIAPPQTGRGASAEDPPAPPPSDLAAPDAANTPIHTGMAGLALVHVHLRTYLERSDCLSASGTLRADAVERAVHLIGLLASGRADLPEHELALPKLLCGLPFGTPVGPAPSDTQSEQDLATNLLTFTAGQVPGLVNTTPDVLRETFLMRHGILIRSAPGAPRVLRVTKGPFDMLLGGVPWPLSVISLPWMTEALHVEWI